jgi:polyphosphate kinase
VHLATGNYNAMTARVYTDLDFLTADEALSADATELFNYLTGYSKQEVYRKFIVSPVNMRERVMDFIRRETERGEEGRIIIKVNSLVDARMIRALYQASQAGVKVDLIVRGICSLRPGLKGVSENIRVLSIVGRFLEHIRIYYFHNEGEPDVYIGSADLMPRNIDRRVEVLFPVEDPLLRKEIVENILNVQLRDTAKGYWLQPDGTYMRAATLQVEVAGEVAEPLFNSQAWFLNGRTTLLQPQMPEVGD